MLLLKAHHLFCHSLPKKLWSVSQMEVIFFYVNNWFVITVRLLTFSALLQVATL